MSSRRKRTRTGAERQAAYAARRRRLTPLQREVRLKDDDLYTRDELVLLARIRRLQAQLSSDCQRLNTRLRARMLAESMDPHANSARRSLCARALEALARRTMFSTVGF